MRRFLKFVLAFALIVFVALPVGLIAFVTLMAALGIAIGIGGAILGLMFTLLKFALIIVLPLLLLWWVAKRLFAPERTL